MMFSKLFLHRMLIALEIGSFISTSEGTHFIFPFFLNLFIQFYLILIVFVLVFLHFVSRILISKYFVEQVSLILRFTHLKLFSLFWVVHKG